MKPVRGFLSDDGNFFESEVAARLHDAEILIRNYCVTHTVEGVLITEDDLNKSPVPKCIDAEKVLSLIEALADPIMSYINAHREASASQPQVNEERPPHSETSKTREDREDEAAAAEAKALFKQQADGHEPMPDMGRSS